MLSGAHPEAIDAGPPELHHACFRRWLSIMAVIIGNCVSASNVTVSLKPKILAALTVNETFEDKFLV
jgi:hypothetical protein